MQLTGPQTEQLVTALTDAFNAGELHQMLRLKLDVRPDLILDEGNLSEQILQLIEWAERNDRVDDLIDAAVESNPDNSLLQQLVHDFPNWTFVPPDAPDQPRTSSSEPTTVTATTYVARDVNVAEGDFVGRDKNIILQLGEGCWQFVNRFMKVMGIGLAAAVIIAAGFYWWSTQPVCRTHPACALVAELGGVDEAEGRMFARDVENAVQRILDDQDLEAALVEIVSGVEDADAARALAAKEDALLIIWGYLFSEAGDKLRIHFELTERLDIDESTALRTYRAQPLLYEDVTEEATCYGNDYSSDVVCYDIERSEIGQHIQVVANAAVGFLHYPSWPISALRGFASALYCAGEEVDLAGLGFAHEIPACTPKPIGEGWSPGLLYYYAGKSAVLSGDYANGIDLLEKAVERQPEDPTAWIGIASAYQGWMGERDSPEAIAALDIADSLTAELIRNSRDADLASAYHNKALIHELRGEWDQAALAYGKAADRFGSQQAAAYNSLVQQASAARRTGEYEIARGALRTARQLDWYAPWAYLERAQLASEGEEGEFAARFWLSNAEAVAPDEPYVHIALADICEKWERYACAERAFARAADLYPQSGWLQSRIGDFYQPESPPQSHQSWQLAADHYERAVELRPKDSLMHERYGFALHSLGRLEEAIDEYRTAVDLAPPDSLPSRLYCNLAVLEREANLHDAAEASEAKCRESETDVQ